MKIFKFIVSIAIPLIVGWVGSLLTMSNIPTWYAFINKSSLTPPNSIFAPVWTTLFILMGISFFIVWIRTNNPKARRVFFNLFFIQLVLNLLWSFLFFGQHLLLWSFVEIIILWIFILLLIIFGAKVSKAAAWLLVPYILWVSFASYLTWSVWMLNR